MTVEYDLRGFWRDLAPSSARTYQEGWRRWGEYCASVTIDPNRASQAEAQAWVDSMKLQGRAVPTIRRRVQGVRMVHEYLAMLGHQPFEPFRMIEVPHLVRRGPAKINGHPPLKDLELGRAMYATRLDDRAHGMLWACAGMGLTNQDLAFVKADRLRRVGDATVAVIQRFGTARLVPVPRELLLVIDHSGWPCPVTSGASAGEIARRALRPFLATTPNALRRWHVDCANRLGIDDENPRRFQWSTHPAVQVCAHLRQLLLDNLPR